MRKLYIFMMISLDGYFEGLHHELTWHNVDAEFNHFANDQLATIDTILFGRRTYDMMAAFWPTPQGIAADPATAELMNLHPKIVFSRTPIEPTWANTHLIGHDVVAEVQALKAAPGGDLAIFGSSNLCVSFLQAGLIDELRIMVNPVVLGEGHPLFAGLADKLSLDLTQTRRFANGNMLLTYTPQSLQG